MIKSIAVCLAAASVSMMTGPAVAAPDGAAPARAQVNHPIAAPRCAHRIIPRGGAIWSDWEFPDDISPYQGSGSASAEVASAYYEGLVTFNSRGKLVPDLLQSLPTVHGLTARAQVKHGIYWSNGREITAADVRFGWEIGMSKAAGTPWCAGSCDAISHIDTIGKYGLVFHLSHPFAPFGDSALYFMPVWPTSWKGGWSKGDVTQAVKKLMLDPTYDFTNPSYPTNGAYQVSQFVKDDRIVLTPMKYYDTMSCGAGLQTLTFAAYNSKDAMIAAAAAHQTDATTDYTEADLPKLNSHRSAFKTLYASTYVIEHLELNVDPTYNGQPNPLSKIQVRQALALALDKYGLVQSATGVSRRRAADMVAWTPLVLTPTQAQPFADKAITGQWDPLAHKYTADTGTGQALADAAKLLAAAGYPGGHFSLDAVTTSGNPTRTAEFAVIQNNWAKVGVSLNIRYLTAGVLFGDWNEGSPLAQGKFQVGMMAGGSLDPDGYKYRMQSQFIDRDQTVHNPTNINYSGIKNPVIDAAFNKAANTYNTRTRAHWYDVWQELLNKNAYWIPLWYRGEITTTDGRIAHYGTNPIQGEEWNVFAWKINGQ